jgi:cytochrome P450
MNTTPATDPYTLSLAEIDVSNPWLYAQDLAGMYFERLRRESPVHYCANGAYGAFWSITRYQDIVQVNADDSFKPPGRVLTAMLRETTR